MKACRYICFLQFRVVLEHSHTHLLQSPCRAGLAANSSLVLEREREERKKHTPSPQHGAWSALCSGSHSQILSVFRCTLCSWQVRPCCHALGTTHTLLPGLHICAYVTFASIVKWKSGTHRSWQIKRKEKRGREGKKTKTGGCGIQIFFFKNLTVGSCGVILFESKQAGGAEWEVKCDS